MNVGYSNKLDLVSPPIMFGINKLTKTHLFHEPFQNGLLK